MRGQFDAYFDSGDAVSFGNMAIALKEDPAWAWFKRLGCDAGSIGNRESQYQAKLLKAKIAGAGHPLLCANLFDRAENLILPGERVIERGGLRIGLIGVMLEMTPKSQKILGVPVGEIAALHWEKAEPIALEAGRRLRSECDLLILLSHIGLRRDRAMAGGDCPFDIILGGHSHDVLESPLRVGQTWICQGGSHGFRAGAYHWVDGNLTGGLVQLRPKQGEQRGAPSPDKPVVPPAEQAARLMGD